MRAQRGCVGSPAAPHGAREAALHTPPQREAPWALVLAGGDGRRLEGLTRLIAGVPIPKQYCRILGDQSLLEATLARTAPLIPVERTLVVVNRDHLALALPQLRRLPRQNVLVQPHNRDTGPGIVFALLHLAARCPQATVVLLPSDHYVGDEAALRAHVERAAHLVDHLPSKIALLGIRPSHAEPGLGYVEPGRPIVSPRDRPPVAYSVKTFHEKPSAECAERLLQRGALWNSFIMVFRVRQLLALVRDRRRAEITAQESVSYDRVPRWNFSGDFLSRIPRHLAVLPVDDMRWSDWGTPEAVERTFLTLGLELPWRRRPARGRGWSAGPRIVAVGE